MIQKTASEGDNTNERADMRPQPVSSGMTNDTPTSGTVMVIDDDRFLADMYSMKFMQKGFAVETYQSVREALAALRSGLKPIVILFDIVMPGEDGLEFLRVVKTEKLAESAALIALTNQGSDVDKSHAEELGADAYIVKASMIPSEVVTATVREMEKKKSIK